MTTRIVAAAGDHRALLTNAGSLFGSTVLTAGVGAVYWAVAARIFPANAVGLGAASISAMQLIGQISTVGLGTVLMGELAGHRSSARSLIGSAIGVTVLIGSILAAAFAVVAGFVLPQLADLRVPLGIILFALGVAATAAGLVLDQALLGLLRGSLQLLRNGIASVAKLVALIAIGLLGIGSTSGLTLLATWAVGGIVSLSVLASLSRRDQGPGRPVWRVIEGVGALAIRHHALNLAILAPGLLLPLIITAVLSTELNAYFYIAYLIAGFSWAIPSALATAVYAAGSRAIGSLTSRVRLAFGICVATGIAFNLVLVVAAQPLLSIFGASYAAHSTTLLRILGLGIFPITINSLFVPITRIERRFLSGTVLMVVSMVIEFAFVVAGAILGGLEGAGVGWLVGYAVSVVPFLPMLIRVGVRGRVEPIGSDALGSVPAGPGRSGSAEAPVPDAVRETPAADAPARRGWAERIPRIQAAQSPFIRSDDWVIGLLDQPVERFLEPTRGSPMGTGVPRWLPRRPGTFAADPFGLLRGTDLHVLFEEFDQRRRRGVIAHLAIAADGSLSDPEPVLDPGCHVSYPFLLEADGEVWMIPETADLAEVRLYRAVDFPSRWQLETVLLAGVPVSDPTLIKRHGRWWMFGTSRGRGVNEALRVWHAPSLTGPWTIHGLDPVKLDARSARPAGTPFSRGSALYRPSQDSSRRYGGSVAINRIEVLTPTAYRERAVATVSPFADHGHSDGVHTINGVGSRTLVDGNHLHFVPAAFVGHVRERVALAVTRDGRGGASGEPAREGG